MILLSVKESFLLELYKKALSLDEKDLYEYFLNHAVNITKSTIGFFHFVSADQKSINLTAWNKAALSRCKAEFTDHYPIEKAGNWADCVRLKRPIIFNDFAKSENQKGLPEGHIPIKRMLSIPIVEDVNVLAVFGVGNKADKYGEDDIIQLDLVASELNKIVKQRQADRELRESKEKYRLLFANMLDGFAFCKMIFDDKGIPYNFVYLEINDSFERLTGLKREAVVGKNVTDVIPGIKESNSELFDIYGKVAAGGKQEKFEIFFKPLNMWLSISVYSPQIGYFAAVFEDISQRKKFEQKLVNAETEWARTFDSVPDLIAVLDEHHKIVRVNKAMAQRLGVAPEQCVGMHCYRCVHGTSHPPEFCPHSLTVQDGQEHEAEIHEDRLGGDFLVTTSPFRDEHGKVLGSVHVVRDITERKKTEETLREQSVVISSALDAIFSTDKSYTIKTWNKAAEIIFGWKAEEVIGKSVTTIFTPIFTGTSGVTREQIFEQLVCNGSWKGELIYHKKDGSTIPVSVSTSQVKDAKGNIAGTVSVLHDITARKKREEILRENQQDLNHAQTVAKAGSWRLDTKQNILLWSDETYRIFEVPKSSPLTYEMFLSFVHPEDRIYVDQKWQEALRGDSYDIEHRILVNGKVKWVHEIAELEFDKDKALKGGFGTVQDITESMEMRLKLEELNKNLESIVAERTKELELKSLYARSLLEASLDPLVTINSVGKITDVNSAAEMATGCSREQMIGNDFYSYFTEPEKAEQSYQEVFTKGYVKDFPLAIRHTSGRTIDVLYNAAVYRNDAGEIQGVFAAARDITELKKAQEKERESTRRLKDAERLAAIGATAGMVGHDIRNPLQAITNDVYLLKSELKSLSIGETKEEMKESLEGIEKNVDYVNKIVQDLQDYARPIKPTEREIDLEALFEEVLFKSVVPENIVLTSQVDKKAKKITTDPEVLKRILSNLRNNAIQAMSEGGKLALQAHQNARETIISIQDTGVGIPEEIKPRLFTPLFTTKSKGQGFGLAVVKRMTEALGGTVSFESEVNKGTKFIVRLPHR